MKIRIGVLRLHGDEDIEFF